MVVEILDGDDGKHILGIEHWALGIGNWELGTCTERSRKACGIATLRAQPKVEKYWALGIGQNSSSFLSSE
ncbi:hypothetical protein [Nostoc sp.]|uniref:hypothetical protein n=1 Tax=Nostoc sp. TaxID=1180 RepID=UPI002FF1DD18